MINRRHIRIKVMQSAYALLLSENDDLSNQERYLKGSIDNLHKLYYLNLQLLSVILKKAADYYKVSKDNFLSTSTHVTNSKNLLKNKVLHQINEGLLEIEEDKNSINWEDYSEVVAVVWEKILQNKEFASYMSLGEPNYEDDKNIIIHLFKKIIAPSDALADFYEGQIISWTDDIPFVNTWMVENLKKIKRSKIFVPDRLYKDKEDKQFTLDLFRKTILNYGKYEEDLASKTPNWDKDRITKIDKLLIVMGIAEFFHFPSIPTKVTINEYIEIAKDYATPKSSYFINGVLDKLLVDYNEQKSIHKIGRGLM